MQVRVQEPARRAPDAPVRAAAAVGQRRRRAAQIREQVVRVVRASHDEQHLFARRSIFFAQRVVHAPDTNTRRAAAATVSHANIQRDGNSSGGV